MKNKNIYLFFKKETLKMLLLGFSSGLPILLIFSTLSVWLFKAGIDRSTITLFSWVGFTYAFKYLWSPIVDNFKIPFFDKMGHRRGWLLFTQLMIIASLILTSLTDPAKSLLFITISITLLAIFSSTQDILIDAFRIESSPIYLQGPLSSMYIAGYRLAMLIGGAGSLWLASYLGSEIYNKNVWKTVYLIMALFMVVGVITTLVSKEPKINNKKNLKINEHAKFLFVFILSLAGFIFLYNFINNPFGENEIIKKFLFSIMRIFLCFTFFGIIIFSMMSTKYISKTIVKKIYLDPVLNFLNRYGKFAFSILFLIALYRIADVVMGVMANIFYLEKGFNINEIATYSKFFGVFATIAGGFLGGFFCLKFGTMRSLFLGAFIASSSNLLFAWLAISEPSIKFLIGVITADNIASGFAGAAFVVYLSALTSLKFTATQYALFSSIMLFIPKLVAGYSGSWVDAIGYSNYFVVTALLGVPVLILIIWLSKVAPIRE
ncbi:MAG: MFS transporter [Candidatus Pelagibacter bacterium]|nr:MFS transporter [Candidatus Pelagibacter bacterium]